MASVENLFAFGVDILRTVVDAATRTVLAQTGDVVQEINEGDGAEWWQHVGFVSRPPRPVAKKIAAQAVAIKRRVRDIIVASRDLRGLELFGALDDGETCVYAPGPDGTAQARILLKKTGSLNLYTRAGNAPDGAGMGIFVDPVTDTIAILNSKGFGLVIDPDGARLTSKDAGLALGKDGSARLVAKTQAQVDGTTVVLGSVAVPAANAALHGPTGIGGVPSAKVLIE